MFRITKQRKDWQGYSSILSLPSSFQDDFTPWHVIIKIFVNPPVFLPFPSISSIEFEERIWSHNLSVLRIFGGGGHRSPITFVVQVVGLKSLLRTALLITSADDLKFFSCY